MWEQLLSALGGNLMGGIKDLVQTFKLPPEQQLQFEQKMAELEANTKQALERIAAEDRNSARQREVAVKDKTPAWLAYGITAGFFGVLAFMLMNEVPPQGHDALLIMLGALGGAWAAVVSYYFGSSAGSERKTELLGKK